MNPFHEWVADTVEELGGDRGACIQYLHTFYQYSPSRNIHEARQALFDNFTCRLHSHHPAWAMNCGDSVH